MALYIVVFSVVIMAVYATNKWEAVIASGFLILLEYITAYYNHDEFIYYNNLLISYAVISSLLAYVTLNTTFLSVYAYIVYSFFYAYLAFQDTLVELGVTIGQDFIAEHYSVIMLCCLALLVYLVIYDRMVICTRRIVLSMR